MNKKQTLFEEKLDDYFLKNIVNSKFPETKKTIYANEFYISSSNNSFNKYYFELRDHYLFCKNDKDSKEIAYMNIKYSFMKLLPAQIIKVKDGTKVFGIKFIKKNIYEEIFSEDEEIIKKLFSHLKQFCVLTKFRYYFESKKLLGKGNFAKVFWVKNKFDHKEYACKVFDKNFVMSDPLEKKCMLYEISMMKEMSHYRLCKLYELYEGENYIYCLQELYRGQTLEDSIIKKGVQPEKKCLIIIQQILEGLSFIHEKNIIHRDIKPENIIFKEEDKAIDLGIVDFGFATYEKDFKLLFTRCGTPGYVAPEVLNDKPYNCKIDIFSCGVILYMILSGKVPFNGNSYKEIVLKNMKGDIAIDREVFEDNISDNTLDLLKCLLKKDPTKRYTAMEALSHAAFDLLEAQSPIKRTKTLSKKTRNFFDFNKFDLKEVHKKPEIPIDFNELQSPDNSPIAKKRSNNKQFEINLFTVK